MIPYRLAVAEILLQKTRAHSVVDAYRALLSKYASANSMANADVVDLERTLLPLGLSKKRARQLKAMAEAAVRLGDGAFADWKIVLSDIPGLGAYAARAIACFARGERIGIVDANIARILRRVFAIETRDPRAVIFQRYANEISAASHDIRATNFGLLDIGGTICLPRPDCDRCPFAAFCDRYEVVDVAG